MSKRVLVAGSRYFGASYRIDRAMLRAGKGQPVYNTTLVLLRMPSGRTRRGADSIAYLIAEDWGWEVELVKNVSEAKADVCLAFLNQTDDEPDDRARITAMKAEKVGIPTWRYYE